MRAKLYQEEAERAARAAESAAAAAEAESLKLQPNTDLGAELQSALSLEKKKSMFVLIPS